MANGVHKRGDNGMLFEEWCGEHSYLRRRGGCDGSSSPVGCDMAGLDEGLLSLFLPHSRLYGE